MVYMTCGPRGGQETCGASVNLVKEGEICEEGCYCPSGTVLHQNKCITRDECPCRLRGKDFPPGAVVPKNCNSCQCVAGQWVCTQVKLYQKKNSFPVLIFILFLQISCGSRCSALGDPHYTTFDGKHYDFMGQCNYYLVKTENFTIEAENVACSGSISLVNQIIITNQFSTHNNNNNIHNFRL